ncbi:MULTISPECIES: carboxymuconolactone decarboxylase family protein [unclassified Nocardia]|uniref:carboxymuconolactone decarboxylase family protein n=1 Tax=unclassified Nocardia TaxID=2637762 RepID=UPI001CE48466|nr:MULTISPECIES: carboxymuconolactone decarboxylase family protein [unclassified Nocardia]
MSRLPLLTAETADAEQGELLTEVRRQLGRVPNLYATMANSPATLRGYLNFRDALTRGNLRARTRERLALLVAAENGCDYCVAAHTMRAGKLGLTDDEIRATRDAHADDPHTDAVLQLAAAVMRTRGDITDDALAAARARDVTDAEIAETIGHVALNTLSNYFNHVARPELDFPPAPAAEPKETVMQSNWRQAHRVQLVSGYLITGRDGRPTDEVDDVLIRIEGGFLHIRLDPDGDAQVVSAPAVRLVTYRP